MGGSAGAIFSRLLDPGDGSLLSLACAASPAHPAVTEAMAEVAADDLPELLTSNGYLPLGLPVLRREIASLLSRSGLPSTPDQVLVSTGAHQAINLAAALLVRPGDTVVVESPSFPGTIDMFRAAGARLVAVPLDDEGADVEAIGATMRQSPPAAVYVMPSFHNPAGVTLAETRRRRLARLAAEAGVPVVEDNALEHARLDVEPPPPVAAFAPVGDHAPVLTLGSLSKALWGGLRVGWIRAPEDCIARLARFKVMSDLGSPLLSQAVAARLLPRMESLRGERAALLRPAATS